MLQANGVVMRFGGFCALAEVDLHVETGERVGLIGPNGSGKSTLTHCIGGALRPTAGEILWDGKRISDLPPHRRCALGIARSFQLPRPFKSMTALENVQLPMQYSRHGASRSVTSDALAVLALVGLRSRRDVISSALTQVELRKLELARAIAAKPRLLIADESMAGLSGSEQEEVLDLLMGMKEQGIAVLMIEHIMHAVTRFSERIVVLVAGRKLADGNPADVLAMPDVISAYLGE